MPRLREAVIGNVVSVKHRGEAEGKPYAEPWFVCMCVNQEPAKFTRYVLVPVHADETESELRADLSLGEPS